MLYLITISSIFSFSVIASYEKQFSSYKIIETTTLKMEPVVPLRRCDHMSVIQ